MPTLNHDQKPVDFSKDRRLWYYLGKASTESKAYYSNDPANPVNDPLSNFLQSVEPAKRPLIPQPQSSRRQSLPASYPGQYYGGANVQSANPVAAIPRLVPAEQQEQQNIEDYQRRMAILGAPAVLASPLQSHNDFARAGTQSALFSYQDQSRIHTSQSSTDPAAREALLAKQRAILERSQQRAMVLDQQDKPYLHKPKSSVSPPNIGIDIQSVERQREFQRRAYQQSLASTQLSSHSPGAQPSFNTNGQMSQWGQSSSPEHGTGPVVSQRMTNTAQYSKASPSPTEAAFPILRRPQQQPISSPTQASQLNYHHLHSQSISSQQQPAHVTLFHNQRRFSQPTYSPSQSSHPQQPSSPSHNLNMSSTGSSAPIDIPQQHANASANVPARNHGQHTVNFIDPNLMQFSPNHPTFPARLSQTGANKDKAEQASRSMPPPPVPSQIPQQTVTFATDNHPKYTDQDGDYVQYTESENKALPTYGAKLTSVLSDIMKQNGEQGKMTTLINDKPVPASIAALRHMSNTHKSRPNIYASPYGYGSGDGVTTKEGITKHGSGLTSRVMDEDNNLDGDEWVYVKKTYLRSKEGEEGTMESEYVNLVIEHPDKDKGKARGWTASSTNRAAASARGAVGGALSAGFYDSRTAEEKKLINEEMRKMGWEPEAGDD